LRIALLEDDPDQSELMSLWLENCEHTVVPYSSGRDFLRDVRRESFDIYLIDWLLPDQTGIDVVRKLREDMNDTTPILIATIKNTEQDVVQALRQGADDYLAKPVRRRELNARIEALHRRMVGHIEKSDAHHAAPYTIDPAHKTVSLNGNNISLTNREFDLTALLFLNAGKVMSRSHILGVIWGIDNEDLSTRTVDTHISRLRKKLQINETNGWKLSAIYQHGYRLEKTAATND